MKAIHYILICCLLGLSGCGMMDSLSQFSKRKYLKKPPKQKAIEQVVLPESDIYTSTAIIPEAFILEQILEEDNSQVQIVKKVEANLISNYTKINKLVTVIKSSNQKQLKYSEKTNGEKLWSIMKVVLFVGVLISIAVVVLFFLVALMRQDLRWLI